MTEPTAQREARTGAKQAANQLSGSLIFGVVDFHFGGQHREDVNYSGFLPLIYLIGTVDICTKVCSRLSTRSQRHCHECQNRKRRTHRNSET